MLWRLIAVALCGLRASEGQPPLPGNPDSDARGPLLFGPQRARAPDARVRGWGRRSAISHVTIAA
eukprot:4841486-Pyramimonas_sp.AAC.1